MINKSIIRRVKKTIDEIEKSLYPTLKQVFNNNKSIIESLNTDGQLYNNSINSKGITLQPSYAQSTIDYKRRNNQISVRVTLRDTGDFYESVNVIAEDRQLIIEASVEYAKYLTAKYGKDILGVTNANLEDFYNKYIAKEIDTNINKIIDKSTI